MKSRVWCVILIFAMLLGIISGLAFRLVEDFSNYECTDAWMYMIQMDGSHSIDLRLQAGTLLQVELDVYAGRVRAEVLDAQGRSLPVIGGWALIPETGRYTVYFRGKDAAFRAVVQCYREPGDENRSATEQAGFALPVIHGMQNSGSSLNICEEQFVCCRKFSTGNSPSADWKSEIGDTRMSANSKRWLPKKPSLESGAPYAQGFSVG